MRYCNYGKSETLKVILPKPLRGQLPPGAVLLQKENVGHTGKHPYGWKHPETGKITVFFYDEKTSDGAWIWINNVIDCYSTYLALEEWKPEDARFCLPIGTKTEVVTTYNLRQWRHVFQMRALNDHAQWEIRELMLLVLARFKELLPSMFGDLTCG
jgi:thymidylate synthase ThyX